MRPTTAAFWSGLCVSVAAHSLYQDAMGLERYLAKVRENWVDPVYTVPIAVALMLVGTGGYVYAKAAER